MAHRPDITGARQVGWDAETGEPVMRPIDRDYDDSPITDAELAAWEEDTGLAGSDLRSCADCGAEYDALRFPQGHPCDR